MADDPLAGWSPDTAPTALADPLAGWQPTPPTPASDTPPPPPPPKGILATSYDQVPSSTAKGVVRDSGVDVPAIRGAFGEGYRSVPESVTRPGERSVLTPEFQKSMAGTWWGPAVNLVGDTAGTAIGGLAGVGNSAMTLGNEALKSWGVPAPAIRDINLEATEAPVSPALHGVPLLPPKADMAAIRELSTQTPSLPDVWKAQRAAIPPDPVTAAINTLLRRNAGPDPTAAMPQPPTPFTPVAQPPPPPPAPGGLLNIPPSPTAPPGVAPTMTPDEILARSQGYFSPFDKQAAQGAMIKPGVANGVRSSVTDTVPTDPQMAVAVGNTPLVQLGKEYQAFQDQPMSFDTVMALDRRLTAERQAALSSKNYTLADQIDDAQGKIRDKVQGLGPDDTTGTPEALANLVPARQAYTQYIKQRQIEDLKYDAGLLPDDKQSAYLTSRGNTMLRGNQTRNWSDAERAAFEQSLKSGQIGTLTNVGIQMIKPAAQAVGGAVGGSVFGTPGAIVGGQIGGGVAEPWAAQLRAALRKVTLDKVSQAISQGVPPPAPGQ